MDTDIRDLLMLTLTPTPTATTVVTTEDFATQHMDTMAVASLDTVMDIAFQLMDTDTRGLLMLTLMPMLTATMVVTTEDFATQLMDTMAVASQDTVMDIAFQLMDTDTRGLLMLTPILMLMLTAIITEDIMATQLWATGTLDSATDTDTATLATSMENRLTTNIAN